MKYSEAMNPDVRLPSTWCAYGYCRYCWWQQVWSVCAHKHAYMKPRLNTPTFLPNTHVQNVHVRVCVSPLRDVESCYSSRVFSAVMLRSYCSLAMLNCPSTTQTHTGCQLAPSDMEKQWWKGETGYCRDSAREETESEAGTPRIQSKIKKKCEREVRRLSYKDGSEVEGVAKRSVNENEGSLVVFSQKDQRRESQLSKEVMIGWYVPIVCCVCGDG